jgi:TLC domain
MRCSAVQRHREYVQQIISNISPGTIIHGRGDANSKAMAAISSSNVGSKRQTAQLLHPEGGCAPWIGVIVMGCLLLSVVYGVAYWIVANSATSRFRPAPQYCPTSSTGEKSTCSRPDLFAFQVAGLVMQLFLGLSGLRAWLVTKHAHAYGDSAEGRLFGYLPDAERLNVGILVFQVWDFVFSIMIPEHATMVFLGHHLAAALTAYFSLEYQYAHHYAIFFGGCSEISSIFLVFCDFDVFFPSSDQGSAEWGTFIVLCQGSFVLLFLAYRVVGWWIVSYRLWKDALYVQQKGLANKYRPGKSWFLYIFLFMDAALGALQLYWFIWGMIPKILEVLN